MPAQSFRGFAERVALVTGGGRGIGRAVALQLALEGAFVIVNYARGDAEGESVARELQEMGTLAHSIGGDVSRTEEVRRVFGMVEETYGRLDMLVNCASAGAPQTLDELTEEAWDEVLHLTLKATFLCSQAAVRLMCQRPAPAIVNVALEAGLTGNGGGAHTVAAHAGIVGLTKALARELAPRIRVNCVAVASAQATNDLPPQADPPASTNLSTGGASIMHRARNLAPDDVARACIYLLSSDASSINGQTLVVGSNKKDEG